MTARKPRVVIGPLSNDPSESVSGVNRAIMCGLADSYSFVGSNADRSFGQSRQSRVNLWNAYYLAKHALIWTYNLLRHQPAIAHYSINSGWALRKALLFLRLARWLGIRTVGHLHSGSFLTFWKTLSSPRRGAALAQLAKLDAFVVLSEKWKNDVAEVVGVPRSKLHVVNNPIDPGFEEAALAMPIERPAPCPELLSMGVMGRDKGLLDLIAACSRARTPGAVFKLHIAGPDREPGISDLASERIAEDGLTSSVTLCGAIHGAQKLALFREAAISILPSYYENFPLVLLEAAAAGHAIVTTPVGAVPEFFVDGESALFVEPGNIDQLAQAMIRLIQNPHERMLLAKNARNVFSSKLSRVTIMRSMHLAYQSALGSGNEEQSVRAESARKVGLS